MSAVRFPFPYLKCINFEKGYRRLSKEPGVYCIYNMATNCFYIGSTNDLYGRLRGHERELIKNVHYGNYLQNSFNKHGIKNFAIILIEYCEDDMYLKREQYYIDTYKPIYNTSKDAKATMKGRTHTKESREKLRIANIGKKLSEESLTKVVETRRINVLVTGIPHGYTFTPDTIRGIRKLYLEGVKILDILKIYPQVSRSTIYDITSFKTWKYLK